MALMAPLKSMGFAYGSEWYEVSDEYDNSVTGFSGNYYYYGYLNQTGKWIIQVYNPTAGTYRYANGASNYSAAWAAAIAGTLANIGFYNALSGTCP
jgi:hypothetical protein